MINPDTFCNVKIKINCNQVYLLKKAFDWLE